MRLVLSLFIGLTIVSTAISTAQDYRNNMFGVRGQGYDRPGPRGEAVAEVESRLRPFYHGVASGDPTDNAVIIWTRITPEGGESEISYSYTVWSDVARQNVVASGNGVATGERDYCVKRDITGLQPGQVYYYAFASNGRSSIIGRARTTTQGATSHARLAVVSCSNYPAGFFNAYARIAERNDLDAVVHLGDYIYEYSGDSTSYSGATGILLGRQHEPDREIVVLADYRTRYAQYRLDPDLRKLHQQHAMIHVWDDHESANDSYRDGADNHQASEGSWLERKAISKRVHAEWMPVRESVDGHIYRQFRFGTAADLFMLDTRLDGRDIQVQQVGSFSTPQSRDSINDVNRKMISQTQFDWFTNAVSASSAKWKVIGNQVIFSPTIVAPIDTAFLFDAVGPGIASFLRPQIPALTAVFEAAFYGDVWNNYPAQRTAIAEFLTAASDCSVVLAGDFHTSFSFDGNWPSGSKKLVEFITPSVTSSNFDENLNANPSLKPLANVLIATIDRTLKNLNPHLKWFDLTNHGYLVLDLTSERAQSDWFMVDTILARSSNERWAYGQYTTCGPNLVVAEQRAPGKAVQDVPAPPDPQVTGINDEPTTSSGPLTIIGHGANPATTTMYVSFVVDNASPVTARLVAIDGSVVVQELVSGVMPGINAWTLDLRGVASGRYSLVLEALGVQRTIVVVVQR